MLVVYSSSRRPMNRAVRASDLFALASASRHSCVLIVSVDYSRGPPRAAPDAGCVSRCGRCTELEADG